MPLEIDESQTARRIEDYVRGLITRHSAEGIVLGLSGGLDSAVLATLAVRSLGNERVHAFYLYDRDSEADSQRRAQGMADRLGFKLETRNIEPVMRERGIYDSFAMRGSALSRLLNRALIGLYQRMFGEPAFMSSLRRGEFGGWWLQKAVHDATVRHIEAAFNARHMYRREFLEEQARVRNCLLLGAANRSECMVGWFVKDGIDDLPLSPIMGLYKTQVRQLAAHLGVPPEIRNQVPSPDMLKGITDEFAVGVDYDHIDIVLDGIEGGRSDDEIIAAGVTRREIAAVRTIHHLSAWKRESPHEEPPVDGSARGGLRVS